MSLKKQIVICTVGTILEWYDYSLFAAMAAIISPLFFPSSNSTTSLMITFAVFATGFLMRPLGALFFGHIGDRIGRKSTLVLTIIIMAIATTAIGLIPLNSQTFFLAPTLLILLRLIQGFASSGELAGGIAWLAEFSTPSNRGFITNFGILAATLGLGLGALVGACVSLWLTTEELFAWGWRIPFLLGAPLGVVALILRYKLAESPLFLSAKIEKNLVRIPALELLRKYSLQLGITMTLYALSNITIYINLVYLTSYLTSTKIFNYRMSLISNLTITCIYALSTLLFGYISDRMNRKKLLIIATCCFIFFPYPLFALTLAGGWIFAMLGQSLLALMLGILSGATTPIVTALFPTNVRYSGIALGINIPAAIFGGTAPLVATILMQVSDNSMAPCYYLILMSIVSTIAVINLPKVTKFI